MSYWRLSLEPCSARQYPSYDPCTECVKSRVTTHRLTQAGPCRGHQCLRLMGMAKPPLRRLRRVTKSTSGPTADVESVCRKCSQQLSPPRFLPLSICSLKPMEVSPIETSTFLLAQPCAVTQPLPYAVCYEFAELPGNCSTSSTEPSLLKPSSHKR